MTASVLEEWAKGVSRGWSLDRERENDRDDTLKRALNEAVISSGGYMEEKPRECE